jgi:hypothetical protein
MRRREFVTLLSGACLRLVAWCASTAIGAAVLINEDIVCKRVDQPRFLV